MATKSFDVAVIGGGPAGYVAGIRLGQLGKKAVVIEREALGGVCLNWGCIPSKALIHAANVVSEVHESDKLGIKGQVSVDSKQLMAWKDGLVDKQAKGIASLLKSNDCAHLVGSARITSTMTLEVTTKEGLEMLEFKELIIASGARVIEIPTFKYDGALVGNARQGVSYDPLPNELVIIGGGVIGCELGTVYRKLGAKVTIVEMLESILPGTDPELVKPVQKRMAKLGIEIFTKARAEGFEKTGSGADVKVKLESGEVKRFHADKILVAVGFAPNTAGLGLEAAGIETDVKGWIPVDEKCRTNVPNIYAAGDVTGPPLLAHRGSKMGEVAAEVIAGKPAAFDVRAMPLGVFTDPEVAQAGLTEAEARAKGMDVVTGTFPISALGRASAMNHTDGLVKIVADKGSDVIVGIGIAAPGACDLIAEACLAVEMGALVEDLALTVHTHPTLSEAVMEAAKAVHFEAIHILNRRRAKPA
ncbi:MAG: dihydrolipoyl dehydrogenase [Deltaproteobacteria bacterium]|nr:dihydrolipoyl dehydrogenase [Deltaproteobacteria bacterium]